MKYKNKKKLKIICIIPARGGSKGIKLKNLKKVCGRSLLSYPVKAAIKSRVCDKIFVSTDSKKIAYEAKKLGASVPFLRKKKFSGDRVTTEKTLQNSLLEAEKYLVNSFLGLPRRAIADGVETAVIDSSKKGIPPTNTIDVDQSSVCYKSFRNIINLEKVVAHHTGGKFYNIVKPIVDKIYESATDKEEKFKEIEERFLNNYTYEYFMVNVGKAEFQEAGSSVAQGSIDVIKAGTAYRIYACGIYDDDKAIIPLESLVVLPG